MNNFNSIPLIFNFLLKSASKNRAGFFQKGLVCRPAFMVYCLKSRAQPAPSLFQPENRRK